MDVSLAPATGPGRELTWLMSLTAEPSTATIHGHLLVDDEAHDLASGLLAFGKAVRELPGQLVHSDDMSLRLELQAGDRALRGTILMDQAGSGKIWVIEMREAPAADETERDRLRLLYDRAAKAYERSGRSSTGSGSWKSAARRHWWCRTRWPT